jgi:hypothetical protein
MIYNAVDFRVEIETYGAVCRVLLWQNVEA